MSNRLEIILSEANDKPVSLSSMSSDALESFMAVMQSLKSIAESTIVKEELSFSISEGSALCAVEAPTLHMNSIFNEVDLAIKGESNDAIITKNLRIIQDQLKRDEFAYKFKYKNQRKIVDLHSVLVNSKRISVKRKKRESYYFKLKIISGYLNQIGGQNPNYHFDYGLKDSVTIDCTMNDAIYVKKYLYQTVESLILCKEWSKKDKKNEYYHKIILNENLVAVFKQFIESYNDLDNLVEKLTLMHDFVDDNFDNSNEGHQVLNHLLIAFNDKNFHLSELKTLLIISKPFKGHRAIKEARLNLLETYQNKRK